MIDKAMKIIILENYANSENTYIVYDENSLEGVVIDPGYDAKKIVEKANSENIKIKYILITHCHYDHIEYLEELRKITGAPLACGKWASVNIGDPSINASYLGLGYKISAKSAEIILADGDCIKIGDTEIKCIYTPGHTNCGVCYVAKNSVFAGDTLFLRNCGRWDLPTGDENTLKKSIREILYKLDDDMVVYPGHGDKTSIGYEKKYNFFVPENDDRLIW